MIAVGGQIFDKADEAAAVTAEVDGLMATTAAELPGLQGKTFAMANFVPGDQIYVVADQEDGSSVFFQQLGMELDPDVLAAADGVSGRAEFSYEQVGLLDGDLLVAFTNGEDPSTIVGFDQLQVVQNGAAAVLDYADVVGVEHADAAVDPVRARDRAAAARRSPREVRDARRDDDRRPVAAFMAERGEELLNRLNADFEDSMLLVGRVLGGRPVGDGDGRARRRPPRRRRRDHRCRRHARRAHRVRRAGHRRDGADRRTCSGSSCGPARSRGEEGQTSAPSGR